MADSSKVNYFAQTDFRGKQTKFGIKSEDRARHIYTIGKTGMGKSTLLENMAVQDIINGEGMAFIDPHGKTADLLLDYVPEERIKDVIYFAPFDLDNPVSFNVMEDVGKDQRHLVANGLMATFKKIWPDVWSARMEYILGNTILALLEYPDSTLLGVNRMLSDKAYRDKVVDNVSDGSVRAFWLDEFANYNERYMQEAGDAIKNKIGQFTANPLIRNIIGQPKSSIDMRKVMDEKKILIINLSKGQVGEQNASLLGGMIITKIYLAAMSRSNVPEKQLRELPYFYFFVDEFQSFVNDSFADILAEARKYKLSLTIAHQYIEQMPETVRNAVFGNVGTTICFRVGPFDAEVLETIFFPTFTKEDLVNLGFAQIYLTLMVDGVGSPPFSATTLPPIAQVENSHREIIINSSRQAYSATREVVEKQINEWQELGRDANPPPRPAARRPGSNGGAPRSWPAKAPAPRSEPPKSSEKPQPEVFKQPEPITPTVSQTPLAKPNPAPATAPAVVKPVTSSRVEATTQPKSISLNQLKHNQNHPPIKSDKHREDLRNALKEAMSLADQEAKNPVKTGEAITTSESMKVSPARPVEPSRPNTTPAPEIKPVIKIESDNKEVPEDVLRKILAGDND